LEQFVGVQIGLGHLCGFAPDHEGFRGLFRQAQGDVGGVDLTQVDAFLLFVLRAASVQFFAVWGREEDRALNAA
jgi:hypothetical protein